MQIDHNGGLTGQFFLLVEGQRFPDEVPETAVVAALDGEFIAVGIVDLFNAAGVGPSTRRGRSGCLAACRPSRAAKRRKPGHLALLWPGKAHNAEPPAEGRIKPQLPVGDLLLEERVVVLRGGKVKHRVVRVGGPDDGKAGVFLPGRSGPPPA